MDIIAELEKKISSLDKSYDFVRVVDPVSKCVIYNKNNKKFPELKNCFTLFNKKYFCRNCISIRAYLENRSFLKLEYLNKCINLVTAMPVIINSNTYVIEFIENLCQRRDELNLHDEEVVGYKSIIENINDQFLRDNLTGLYNKNYINERLSIDLFNAQKSNSNMTIILFDIFNMKEVNIEFGYTVGDKLLYKISEILVNFVKKENDWIGRLDEDSFIMILNSTSYQDGKKFAEKVKTYIENYLFELDNKKPKVIVKFNLLCTKVNIQNVGIIYDYLKGNLTNINKKSCYEVTVGEFENDNNKSNSNVNNLYKLSKSIDELRDTLNEICATADGDLDLNYRLKISEYLDALIVEYMQKLNNVV